MSTPFKRKDHIRFAVGLIFACSIIGIALFSTSILRVSIVHIEGSQHYDEEKIMSAAGLSKGMHILQVNKKRSVKGLLKLAYLDGAKVDTIFPNTLQIIINERKPIGYVPFTGTYLSIDKTGKVIDQTQYQEVHNLPIIEGLKFDKFVLGEQLEVENEEVIMAIIEMSTLMEKYNLLNEEIKIDVGDPNGIRLYINSLDVIIGEISNLDKKIQWLCGIIDQHQMGILDLTNINKGQAIMSPLT